MTSHWIPKKTTNQAQQMLSKRKEKNMEEPNSYSFNDYVSPILTIVYDAIKKSRKSIMQNILLTV